MSSRYSDDYAVIDIRRGLPRIYGRRFKHITVVAGDSLTPEQTRYIDKEVMSRADPEGKVEIWFDDRIEVLQ